MAKIMSFALFPNYVRDEQKLRNDDEKKRQLHD